MKLNLVISGNNYQIAAEASSLTEFKELRDFLRAEGLIGGEAGGAAPTTKANVTDVKATEVKAEKPAATAKAESKPAADKPAATGKGKPAASAKAAATAKTDAGPTIEEVTAALTAVADKFGVQEALTMNKRFGVKKAGELDSKQYADYIRFAEHCVADDAAPSDSHPDFDGGSDEGGDDDVSNLV
jgi:hypothetical protein